jgi:hypothetical protein
MSRNEKVENATIDFGCEEGDRIFLSIIKDYPELDENDCRRSTIIFSLFTNAIQYLHATGWSEKSLVKEVFDHCEIARDMIDEDDEQ